MEKGPRLRGAVSLAIGQYQTGFVIVLMLLVNLVNLPINLGTVSQMVNSIDEMVRASADIDKLCLSDLLTLLVRVVEDSGHESGKHTPVALTDLG